MWWMESLLAAISVVLFIFWFFFFNFFVFSGSHLRHIEVPRLRVQSELQLPAYTIATIMWDQSRVCKLHHSSQQLQILSSLSKARDRTCVLMDTSWVRNL